MKEYLSRAKVMNLTKVFFMSGLNVPEVVVSAHLERPLGSQIIPADDDVDFPTDPFQLVFCHLEGNFEDSVKEGLQSLRVNGEVTVPVLESPQVLTDMHKRGRDRQDSRTIGMLPDPLDPFPEPL